MQSDIDKLETETETGGVPAILRRRISSNVADLDAMHAVHHWIPSSSQIRPHPELLQTKLVKIAKLQDEWASMADFVRSHVFGKSSVIRSDGKRVVRDNRLSEVDIVFIENDFPYALDEGGQHWVLWFGCRDDPRLDIDTILSRELQRRIGHDGFDFAWYENPKMSIPEYYHVQVFWIHK